MAIASRLSATTAAANPHCCASCGIAGSKATARCFIRAPRVGYYDQSLQQLRDDQTLSAALHGFAALSDEQCKMALISAGFPWLRHQQKVASLSGGERSRLLLSA